MIKTRRFNLGGLVDNNNSLTLIDWKSKDEFILDISSSKVEWIFDCVLDGWYPWLNLYIRIEQNEEVFIIKFQEISQTHLIQIEEIFNISTNISIPLSSKSIKNIISFLKLYIVIFGMIGSYIVKKFFEPANILEFLLNSLELSFYVILPIIILYPKWKSNYELEVISCRDRIQPIMSLETLNDRKLLGYKRKESFLKRFYIGAFLIMIILLLRRIYF